MPGKIHILDSSVEVFGQPRIASTENTFVPRAFVVYFRSDCKTGLKILNVISTFKSSFLCTSFMVNPIGE